MYFCFQEDTSQSIVYHSQSSTTQQSPSRLPANYLTQQTPTHVSQQSPSRLPANYLTQQAPSHVSQQSPSHLPVDYCTQQVPSHVMYTTQQSATATSTVGASSSFAMSPGELSSIIAGAINPSTTAQAAQSPLTPLSRALRDMDDPKE